MPGHLLGGQRVPLFDIVERKWGADLARLRLLEDLLEPTIGTDAEDEGAWTCYGAVFRGQQRSFKLWFSPDCKGVAETGAVCREVMRRLGLGDAWDWTSDRLPETASLLFGLELRDGPDARVKLYVRVQDPDFEKLEGVASLAERYVPGDLAEVLDIARLEQIPDHAHARGLSPFPRGCTAPRELRAAIRYVPLPSQRRACAPVLSGLARALWRQAGTSTTRPWRRSRERMDLENRETRSFVGQLPAREGRRAAPRRVLPRACVHALVRGARCRSAGEVAVRGRLDRAGSSEPHRSRGPGPSPATRGPGERRRALCSRRWVAARSPGVRVSDAEEPRGDTCQCMDQLDDEDPTKGLYKGPQPTPRSTRG